MHHHPVSHCIAQSAPGLASGHYFLAPSRQQAAPQHVCMALRRAFKQHKDLLWRQRNNPGAGSDSRQARGVPAGCFQVGAAMQASPQGQGRSMYAPSSALVCLVKGEHYVVLDTLQPGTVAAAMCRLVQHRAGAWRVATFFVPKLTNQGMAIRPFLEDADVQLVMRYMESEEAASTPTGIPHLPVDARLSPFQSTTAITVSHSIGAGRGGRVHIHPHVDARNLGTAQSLQTTESQTTEPTEVDDEVVELPSSGSDEGGEGRHEQQEGEGGLRLFREDWVRTSPNSLIQDDFDKVEHCVVLPRLGTERTSLVRYRNKWACVGGQLLALGAARVYGCGQALKALRTWLRDTQEWSQGAAIEWSWSESHPHPPFPTILQQQANEGGTEVWWCTCSECRSLQEEHQLWCASRQVRTL